MAVCITERLRKLRELREKLCDKQTEWKDAFKLRDWVVSELKELSDITKKPDSSMETVQKKIDDMLELFEPKDKGDIK